MRWVRAVLAAVLMVGPVWIGPVWAGQVTVFAAASLKTALDEIAETYEAATGQEIALSFAGSSVLARQIQLGAPADLFVSANEAWMDVLAADGVIKTESRVDIVGNRLVLVGHRAAEPAEIGAGLAEGRVAMALVDAVPAGVYGKAALQAMGLWDVVAPRVVQADNVRAALAFVALGEVPLGIVYATDAAVDPRVSVIATFPAQTHPPIRYPAALTTGARPEAADFLVYLTGAEARTIFDRLGFARPGG